MTHITAGGDVLKEKKEGLPSVRLAVEWFELLLDLSLILKCSDEDPADISAASVSFVSFALTTSGVFKWWTAGQIWTTGGLHLGARAI